MKLEIPRIAGTFFWTRAGYHLRVETSDRGWFLGLKYPLYEKPGHFTIIVPGETFADACDSLEYWFRRRVLTSVGVLPRDLQTGDVILDEGKRITLMFAPFKSRGAFGPCYSALAYDDAGLWRWFRGGAQYISLVGGWRFERWAEEQARLGPGATRLDDGRLIDWEVGGWRCADSRDVHCASEMFRPGENVPQLNL